MMAINRWSPERRALLEEFIRERREAAGAGREDAGGPER